MSLWWLLWPALGALGYAILVRLMLRWDRFDIGYLMIFPFFLFSGPFAYIIVLYELHEHPLK